MAYEPKVIAVGPVFEVTLYTAITCRAGNLLAHNGTGWVLADANTPATLSAKAIATHHQPSAAGKVAVCREAYIQDDDAPYTMNAFQYLSATAGAITETKPAADGDLWQVVGVALSTSLIHVKINPPHLVYTTIGVCELDTTAEAGLGVADSGWAGPSPDGNGETANCAPFRVPKNCVALDSARLFFDSVNASALTLAVTSVYAYAGASNVQGTGTATATDWEQEDTDNIIYSVTIKAGTALDATAVTPGRLIQLHLVATGITGDAVFLGGEAVFQCVD